MAREPVPYHLGEHECRRTRLVAGVLRATGAFTPAELERANQALSALGRPPLAEHDFVSETPETLAPMIRFSCAARFSSSAYRAPGDEPIRRRLADAYAGLWDKGAEIPARPRSGPALSVG